MAVFVKLGSCTVEVGCAAIVHSIRSSGSSDFNLFNKLNRVRVYAVSVPYNQEHSEVNEYFMDDKRKYSAEL